MYQVQDEIALQHGDNYSWTPRGQNRGKITNKGFELDGQGFRFNFAGYEDLYC